MSWVEILRVSMTLSKRGKRGAVIAFIVTQILSAIVGVYHVILGVYAVSASLAFIAMGFVAAYAVGLFLTPLGYQGEEDN